MDHCMGGGGGGGGGGQRVCGQNICYQVAAFVNFDMQHDRVL